ncbi:MAG: porin family protein, partial [Phreatobacter sp.]|nr:porin family protein [Phreatobacter sp.]
MKKLLLAVVAAVTFGTGAQAADLGSPRMPIAAAVVAPAFNWTGFYIGGQVGYGWAHQGWLTPPALTVPWKSNGIFGGLHVGYNQQINMLVIGVQAEINAAGLTGSTVFANRT